MAVTPFKVKAVYEYKSGEPDDLSFPNGQIITVTEVEDDDWYSGEYINAVGERVDGIFPRNFVEKYEPAIPSRPTRTPKRTTQPGAQEQEQTEARGLSTSILEGASPEDVQSARIEPPLKAADSAAERTAEPHMKSPPQVQTPVSSTTPKSPTTTKPAVSKPPPPVAEKPSGNSFRDRIAAFNKPAAPPVAPFKPGGQAASSTGFIKKPFVAPPPDRKAYVPPPREPQPQKIYRREEEPELSQIQATGAELSEPVPVATEIAPEEDQPKPTTLKERIEMLKKQQMEQAARHAEATPKKERPKKPTKKRTESSEDLGHQADQAEMPLERVDTNETVGKKSVDFADDEAGRLRGPRRQPSGRTAIQTPPPPSRELMSDTNDADDSGAGDTEDALETSTEEDSRLSKREQTLMELRQKEEQSIHIDDEKNGEAEEGEEDEDEEEVEDPEIRRKRELRERMAKMSGGYGMMGIFGGPAGPSAAGPARKPKPYTEGDRVVSNQHEQDDSMSRAPPVPITGMALPGMNPASRPEPIAEPESDEEDTAQHTPQESDAKGHSEDEEAVPFPPKRTSTDRAARPVPQDRAVPQPLPREARAAPPLTLSERAMPSLPQARPTPLPPPATTGPTTTAVAIDEGPVDQPSPTAARPRSKDGQFVLPGAPPVPSSRPPPESLAPIALPSTSQTAGEKRSSRAPPPLPPMSPTIASPQARAPPPPPPGQPPSRRSTSNSHHSMASSKHQVDNDSEEEVTEYDGDYDTDIASSAKHKDALKSHNRDSSLDDGPLGDEPPPTNLPARAVPPLPSTAAPRDIPPMLPPSVPKSRKSMDAPRAAPPPVPPPKEALDDPNGDYDPYRYATPQQGGPAPPARPPGYAPVLQSPKEELEEEDMYEATPHAIRAQIPGSAERGVSSQPPYIPAPPMMNEVSRESPDIRRSNTLPRRSMEQSRPSSEQGFIASDLDLAPNSMWWAQDKLPPPSLQNRSDVRYEIESTTSTKRGGKTTISKDVYLLYMDYSQSTINATYDPNEPSHATLEQSHERPPPPLRQDQLEDAAKQFSSRIAESAATKANTTVADGSAQGFINELLQPLSGALLPIGTRAYGALVYANLANASTQQYDEIRAGDIVTFRNAKFSGHKGGLHSKYSMDAGKPDHVAVVIEWDGAKKKIRAWEQGREADGKASKKGKVKDESFRVGDLRSGEVRVWRVMGRKWVGWN